MKKWYKVRVTFPDQDIFEDEIKGINQEDALKNAYDNWEDAILIELV